MGTNPNWPDRNSSAGGMGPDGHAVRHSEARLNVALPALGWLTNQEATSNPRCGGWENIGMNSAVGSSTKFARTLGQAQGRR
jgi:hypothetical protein